MWSTLRRAALFALYQVTLLAGVLLLPVALAARQVGVRLPVGTAVERLGRAYGAAR